MSIFGEYSLVNFILISDMSVPNNVTKIKYANIQAMKSKQNVQVP